MGPGALSAGGESLLVPALVLSAIGATLVAVLLHRLSAVADERSSLSLLATHMRELHTVADRHRVTLERLPDPVVLRGPSRSILLSNAAFDQLIGPVREGSDASAAEPEIVEIGTRMVRPDGTTAVEEAIRTEAGTRWFSGARSGAAARSPTGSRTSGPSRRPGRRQRPPAKPSPASWRPSATNSARP
jgi:hypothetical protein